VSLSSLRAAAALLPAALALHEGAYALGGGEAAAGAHGYLERGAPVIAALVASLLLAALLGPLLGARPGGGPDRRAPLALAGALLAIFLTQEAFEVLVLGGGVAALTSALAIVWIALPFALLFGSLASQAIVWLERAGEALASLAAEPPPAPRDAAPPPPPVSPIRSFALSPLAFGLARRPPPVGA
jgi:hypothetical protein